MNLIKVTITGADNSISVKDLLPISERFPFVEWGILVSNRAILDKRKWTPRFPSLEWLRGELSFWHKVNKFPLNLSCHVCGKWVRDICVGKWTILDTLPILFDVFDRIQLNFHASHHEVNNEAFLEGLKKAKQQFIFQYENVNNYLFDLAQQSGINAVPLFDRSGGAGILPNEWPKPIMPMCGYAGGLSPDNLQEQLELISKVCGDTPIWIDAETHMFTGIQFDLDKVTKFLEIAEKWIEK